MFFNILFLNYVKSSQNNKMTDIIRLDEPIIYNLIESGNDIFKYKQCNNTEDKKHENCYSEFNVTLKSFDLKKDSKINKNKAYNDSKDKHLPLKKRRRCEDYYNLMSITNEYNKPISNVNNICNKKNISKKSYKNFNSSNTVLKNSIEQNNFQDINNEKFNSLYLKNYNENYLENKKDDFTTKVFQNNDVSNTGYILKSSVKASKYETVNKNLLLLYNETNNLPNSSTFMTLFTILKQDLINILKNSFKYFYKENTIISDLISLLEANDSNNTSVLNFINILNTLLNINIKYDQKLEYDTCKNLDSIIKNKYNNTSSLKKLNLSNFSCKLYKKCISLEKKLEKNNLTDFQMLKYTLHFVNNLIDKNSKQLCIFGLQNFFINDICRYMPRFYYVLIFFYKFVYEKNYYDIDWCAKLFKIISLNPNNFIEFKNLLSLNNSIFEKNDLNIFYMIYITINSKDAFCDLNHYTELQKNKLHLELFNNMIDKLNEVKYRLYGITK